MLTLLLPLLVGHQSVPRALGDYLHAPDRSYKYAVEKQEGLTTTLVMTSQTWHGIPWKHEIIYSKPPKVANKGVAILFITGDGPRPGDYRDISLFTAATGMPVAMLFGEPNQPIYGMREDDLIAHTFEQYLSTGDKTWPLLFPMTKAAIRAMDTVVSATKGSDNPITRFVVTGASKRGWTTWLTAASQDRRILGIAPMVYDNLNIVLQMKHQLESWGAYSESIQDYTRRGLQAKLSSPTGQELSRIVDPYSYRRNFKVPILVVKGSNDPYWAADATSLYWADLPTPHWLLTVPNAGHTLGGGFMAAQTVGAFARSLAGEFPMPDMSIDSSTVSFTSNGDSSVAGFKIDKDVAMGSFTFHGTKAIRRKVWLALSDTTDFRQATFKQPDIDADSGDTISFHFPSTQNAAIFVQEDFKSPDGREFSLSSPTVVFKKR